MEFRNTDMKQSQVRVETREDKRYVVGYAAVFYRENDPGTEYWLWRDLVERIKPGAFKRALKEKDDVRALFNHDPNQLLSRIGNGLKLSTDDVGLRYEFPIDESDPDHLRVVAKIERGDLSGSSFGFYPEKRTFIEEKEFDVVELNSVELIDVSPATFPAYSGTDVGMRSNDDKGITETRKAYDEWKKENKKEDHDLLVRQMKAEAGIL